MKIIVWKKKAAALLAAALATGIAGYVALYPAAAYVTDRQLPVYCVDKAQQKVCSVSFDAAWGNEKMRQRDIGISRSPEIHSSVCPPPSSSV